jgi:hypothetical protein
MDTVAFINVLTDLNKAVDSFGTKSYRGLQYALATAAVHFRHTDISGIPESRRGLQDLSDKDLMILRERIERFADAMKRYNDNPA